MLPMTAPTMEDTVPNYGTLPVTSATPVSNEIMELGKVSQSVHNETLERTCREHGIAASTAWDCSYNVQYFVNMIPMVPEGKLQNNLWVLRHNAMYSTLVENLSPWRLSFHAVRTRKASLLCVFRQSSKLEKKKCHLLEKELGT